MEPGVTIVSLIYSTILKQLCWGKRAFAKGDRQLHIERHGLTAAWYSPKELIAFENDFKMIAVERLCSSAFLTCVSFLWRVCVKLRAVSAVVGWVLSSSLTYFRTSLQLSAVYRRSSAEDVDPVTKTRRWNAESRALLCHFYPVILQLVCLVHILFRVLLQSGSFVGCLWAHSWIRYERRWRGQK